MLKKPLFYNVGSENIIIFEVSPPTTLEAAIMGPRSFRFSIEKYFSTLPLTLSTCMFKNFMNVIVRGVTHYELGKRSTKSRPALSK